MEYVNWIVGYVFIVPKLSVIENTRFCIGEKTNDIDLSKRLAKLADLFVMDAFATSWMHLKAFGEIPCESAASAWR